jgi:hypothetical protein
MMRSIVGVLGVMMLVAMCGIGGCGGGASVVQPGVVLRPDDTLRDPVTKAFPPIRAHVIGVNDEGKKAWEGEDVTKHFTRSREQAAAMNAREFSLETGDVRLSAEDPAWAGWNKPMYLVVLVDLPGKGGEGGKPNDPRRYVLSLNKNRWTKLEGDILLSVTRDQVVLKSEQTPVKPGEF